MVCLACGKRPRHNGTIFCHTCGNLAPTRKKVLELCRRAIKVATWRGYSVAFLDTGNGTCKAVAVHKAADKLPKRKTLDLNGYIKGYDREQIAHIKRAIKQCHSIA